MVEVILGIAFCWVVWKICRHLVEVWLDGMEGDDGNPR